MIANFESFNRQIYRQIIRVNTIPLNYMPLCSLLNTTMYSLALLSTAAKTALLLSRVISVTVPALLGITLRYVDRQTNHHNLQPRTVPLISLDQPLLGMSRLSKSVGKCKPTGLYSSLCVQAFFLLSLLNSLNYFLFNGSFDMFKTNLLSKL